MDCPGLGKHARGGGLPRSSALSLSLSLTADSVLFLPGAAMQFGLEVKGPEGWGLRAGDLGHVGGGGDSGESRAALARSVRAGEPRKASLF